LDGRDRGLILSHYPGIRLEGLGKATKTFSQYSRSPGQDLNPGHPEYEGVLTTRPRRSVTHLINFLLTVLISGLGIVMVFLNALLIARQIFRVLEILLLGLKIKLRLS
jgi:hypothetical protein